MNLGHAQMTRQNGKRTHCFRFFLQNMESNMHKKTFKI